MSKINIYDISALMKQAQTKQEDPIKIAITQALKAGCSIYVSVGNKTWTGSGFHLGNGYIATASHVTPPDLQKQGYEIIATFDNKTQYSCTIAVSEPMFDAAIIFCPNIINTIPSVKLADSDLAERGDIIAVISSPEGWHDTTTVGRISNMHQSLGDDAPSHAWNDIIFIDADILMGSSGGMVIGTDGLVYGLVMGLTGQLADYGVGENSVCPSNKIKQLLASLNSKKSL